MSGVDGVTISPLVPAIGAVIKGIDLTKPLSSEQLKLIEGAVLKYYVIFFENQEWTPAVQKAFAAQFGDLHIHPIYPNVPEVPEIIILDTHADNLPDNDTWHTDVTFITTPPMGSVLTAKQLPPCGGDTLWSSMEAAYNALSAPIQKMLDGLHASHDFAQSFPSKRYFNSPSQEEQWKKARAANPPVIHPVVRRHPVTGNKCLFVSEGFTTHITDLSKKESEVILRFLFEHIQKPEFTVRWHWKVNDVAFWDNRNTQHYATADYLPHRRIMHRATILGDRPV
eukprot:TRINITY_DN2402_c0_g1_i2.p2 TRINITY_DN2402_c0_g1~~TRINITY_DN2402_c0_g1_i2.p2  ORF type:complete len:282 (+),score=92.59 TRINITY_DN2402_c0_g1_i2:85-930(+)